jgi:hypothetical protein
MSDFRLDADGDLDLTNGEISLTGSGQEAIAQRLKQRLSFFLGEWFLDQTRGIPFIQQIFVKRPNPVVVDAVFKSEILQEPSVTELQEFELDLDTATRELTLSFRVQSEEGEINFSEVFRI